MPHFNAFISSAPGIGGTTVAQRLSAVARPGVLNIKSANITADTSAGFTLAELECGWDSAETSQGVFNSGYLSSQAAIAATLKADGYQVVVSAGIFNYPSWLPGYIGSTWQYADQLTLGTSCSFTATNASPCVFTPALTPVFSTAFPSGLPNGFCLVLNSGAPTGFSAGTAYFVVNSTSSTFQLSATSGGSPIASSSTGSGTFTGGYSGSPNFMWNPAVRTAAAAYISQLTAAMVTAGVDVDYYRIGIAPSGEMFLPAINTGAGVIASGGWWAFDTIAQGSAGGLPAGISACPHPGWIPGTTTGGTLTALQATDWWNWYMGAVNNAHQWEIDAHRAGGWAGAAMLCMPGLGASPDIIRQRLAASPPLSASPADYAMNIATAWHLAIQTLASPADMVVDISSVLDGSGGTVPSGFGGNTGSQTGVNNVSGPLDDTMTLTATSGPCADFNYSHWSATRWISYLARAYGLKCVGENPGDDGTSFMQSLAIQAGPAMTQAQACGLYGLMWAADVFMAEGGAHGYATPSQVMTAFNAVF